MGCKYCSSGLGLLCNGPDGLDDLEAACDCECHDLDDMPEIAFDDGVEELDIVFPDDDDWRYVVNDETMPGMY